MSFSGGTLETNFAPTPKQKATTMAVTLNTTIGNILFSSAIPDLSLTTSDDSEAEIILRSPDLTIFSAVHFPYSRGITIHDLRSVVEL